MLQLQVDAPETPLLLEAERYARQVIAPWVSGKPNFQNFWFVSGPVGTGKTCAALRVANFACQHGITAEYWLLVNWLNALKATYGTMADTAQIILRVRDVPMLILDDIGAGQGNPLSLHDRGQLEQVLVHRHQFALPTILVTNMDAQTFAGVIGVRVMDRLSEACFVETVIPNDTPSFREVRP